MPTKLTPAEISANLAQYTGTETLTKVNNSVITDGVRYLAETCGAFWLIDIINSYQHKYAFKRESFQTWTLVKLPDGSWGVLADDGNGNELTVQHIEYSDFPLDKITLWRVDSTIMLPSEY